MGAGRGHEGVLNRQPFQRTPLAVTNDRVSFDAITSHGALDKGFGQNKIGISFIVRQLHQRVGQVRIERNALVGGQGPRGGGPDDDTDASANGSIRLVQVYELELFASIMRMSGHIAEFEPYIDGIRGLVLILHLGFRQRGAAVHAPVHRLAALHQVAVGDDLAEGAQDVGLEPEVHGQVGAVPVAQHAQAHEVGLLARHLLGGIDAAGIAEFARADLVPGLAQLLLHLQLDRQAVAVPARHIGRVEARQGLALDDDVLEHLVDRVADVDVAVGIGRAVMQHELRPPGAGLADAAVQALLLPAGECVRLALRQVAAHREPGVRQIEGGLVDGFGCRVFGVVFGHEEVAQE